MKKIFIVESPNKIKSIQSILPDFTILATGGHIYDLSKKTLGYDIDYTPDYVKLPSCIKLEKNLKEYIEEQNSFFIGTDPDREGELIAFHVFALLYDLYKKKFYTENQKDNIFHAMYEKDNNIIQKIKKTVFIKRIVFKAIDKTTIFDSLKNSLPNYNEHLVFSQQTRRILDRMIGFTLSASVRKQISLNVSFGRVQTVALRKICEKTKDFFTNIQEVKYCLYYVAKNFSQTVAVDTKQDIKNINVSTLNIKEFSVSTTLKTKSISSPNIFSTVLLQKRAQELYGFSYKKTMNICQELFEGVPINNSYKGLISYPRTDSDRLSQTFCDSVTQYLLTLEFKTQDIKTHINVLEENKKYVQDAHEGIRPVNIKIRPEDLQLEKDKIKIYELIYYNTLCHFLHNAIIKEQIFMFKSGDYSLKLKKQEFVEKNFTIFKPILRLLNIKLLNFDLDGEFVVRKISNQTTNKVSENAIINHLQKHNIGRPSTYSTILDILYKRNYIEQHKNNMVSPTDLGLTMLDIAIKKFNIFEYDFSSNMEQSLEEIAHGILNKKKFLQEFENDFVQQINNFENNNITGMDDMIDCFFCSEHMTIKMGRFGCFSECPRKHKVSLSPIYFRNFLLNKRDIKLAFNVHKYFTTQYVDSKNHILISDNSDTNILFCLKCKIHIKKENIIFGGYSLEK